MRGISHHTSVPCQREERCAVMVDLSQRVDEKGYHPEGKEILGPRELVRAGLGQ
jgi:hypothetical protein